MNSISVTATQIHQWKVKEAWQKKRKPRLYISTGLDDLYVTYVISIMYPENVKSQNNACLAHPNRYHKLMFIYSLENQDQQLSMIYI